jgi:WD40 repeat protein
VLVPVLAGLASFAVLRPAAPAVSRDLLLRVPAPPVSPAQTSPRNRMFAADAFSNAVFSPDGTVLARGGADNTVRFWDVRTNRELAPIKFQTPEVKHETDRGVTFVAYSPDGKTLLSGGSDRAMFLWDVSLPE